MSGHRALALPANAGDGASFGYVPVCECGWRGWGVMVLADRPSREARTTALLIAQRHVRTVEAREGVDRG